MLTEIFVVAKSINSLGQIEASVANVVVALSGPLVESDTVFSIRADACEARDRLERYARSARNGPVQINKTTSGYN